MEQNKFLIARGLILVGIGIILNYWLYTIPFSKIKEFSFNSEYSLLKQKIWFHLFRELSGDLASFFVFGIVFFGKASWRTIQTWRICFVIMFGVYAPFWLSAPFLTKFSVPESFSELAYLGIALPFSIGLLISKKEFYDKKIRFDFTEL